MEIRKIEKFEKHIASFAWESDSYSVWYEGLGDNRACMSNVRFELAKCIDEFLRRAIAPEDIKRLIELASDLKAEESLESYY